jgi:hypothetical protein
VSLQQDYASTIRRVLPSVVEIKTASGLGSGVVYDAAGHIVTNAHVVGSATSFQVVLAGSAKPLPAHLTGSYPPDDLAVIQVRGAAHLVPAHFGDSSKLRVGDIVLAMGNPLGLASSVTDGIVSAVGRTVSEPQGNGSPGATLPDVIQTSAAINPGNSGGALVNLANQVVGIPTLAATDQQIGGAAPGIGFAIPSNIVTDIAGQIIKTGHVTDSHRAALGVEVQTVMGPSGQPAGVSIAAVTPGGPDGDPRHRDAGRRLGRFAPRAAGFGQHHQSRRQHHHHAPSSRAAARHLTSTTDPGPRTRPHVTPSPAPLDHRQPHGNGMVPIPTPRPIGRGRPRAAAPSPLISAAGCLADLGRVADKAGRRA